ncbi:MAG: DUF1588 domain-containing protein [Archangium sp.]|nr:DUF1588 domain-containing protein [Archangium sp.]
MRRALPLLTLILTACTGELIGPRPEVPPLVEPPPPEPEVCDVPNPLPAAVVPMRRLNRVHVEATVRDVLGVTDALAVPDERVFTYRSNISTSVDDNGVQAYFDFAERVTASPTLALTACTRNGCLAWLLDDVAPRFFRRPLSADERTRYQTLFNAGVLQAMGSPTAVEEGARWVLQALLQSPTFLYVDEPLTDAGMLDGYGVATRLSLSLWGANPDTTLLAASGNGSLDTADGVRAQVRLMLEDPRSERGFNAFVSQWLELERLRQTDARPDLTALGEPLLHALETEPVLYVRTATLAGADLASLFSDSRTVSMPALVPHYGMDLVSTTGNTSSLDPSRRAGLLTLPGVMAAMSHAGVTSPTVRGYAVLANVMCTPPSPPPAGLNITLPPPSPGTTTRARLEAHFTDPGCAYCHRPMDGLGFTFEHLDELGRWRLLDNNLPIDDSADFPLGADQLTVQGPRQLADALSQRAEVRTCFAKQWMRYAAGTLEPASVKCFAVDLGSKGTGADGLERVITEFAASEYFRKGTAP